MSPSPIRIAPHSQATGFSREGKAPSRSQTETLPARSKWRVSTSIRQPSFEALRFSGVHAFALLTMFLLSVIGMIGAGRVSYNEELRQHGSVELTLLAYVAAGDFLSAFFENWESEFLQMAAYVVLTAILFQRGSAESRDPDDPYRPADLMATSRVRPFLAWVYQHSLGLALALLFVASFVLHVRYSLDAANERAALHEENPTDLVSYLTDPQLWFESFQNWQSEFMSTGVLVVLSIFLRHKGSPESKPVGAEDRETGA